MRDIKSEITSIGPTPPAEEKKPASFAATICEGKDAASFVCYESHYTSLVRDSGIRSAFADLRRRYDSDGYVKSQCHPLAHVIGRIASEQFERPGDAYQYADSFCWSGYHHGVLEGIIGRVGLNNLPKEINGICANIHDRDRYGFDYYNCVHGLGHGVMSINQNHLFKALAMCDYLEGNWEQISCASGAYMENIIIDGKNHKTEFLKPEDPLYPCNASPEKYTDTCYLMQTSYMLKINGYDFAKTFEWCENAGNYRNTCYVSIGRDASGSTVSDPDRTAAKCLLGKKGDPQQYCIDGAVKDFISYYHSDKEAKKLCEVLSDEGLKTSCQATASSYYQLF
jgi:hypothetical protein